MFNIAVLKKSEKGLTDSKFLHPVTSRKHSIWLIQVSDSLHTCGYAEIIERWGNRERDPNNYIFSILDDGLSHLEQHFLIRSFIRFVNNGMAKIKQ